MLNIGHKLISIFSIIYTFMIRHKFYHLGKAKVYINTIIANPKQISIGDYTIIRDGSWLLAIESSNTSSVKIDIGKNIYFGRYLHLTALNSVIIKDNVLIADRVYISDNNHGYRNVNIPIKDQEVTFKGPVVINEGAWVGENVCIIGASIGQNSIVGANSVVLKDVPDHAIVVGNPAKIVKRYSFEKGAWLKTNEMGEFLNE